MSCEDCPTRITNKYFTQRSSNLEPNCNPQPRENVATKHVGDGHGAGMKGRSPSQAVRYAVLYLTANIGTGTATQIGVVLKGRWVLKAIGPQPPGPASPTRTDEACGDRVGSEAHTPTLIKKTTRGKTTGPKSCPGSMRTKQCPCAPILLGE